MMQPVRTHDGPPEPPLSPLQSIASYKTSRKCSPDRRGCCFVNYVPTECLIKSALAMEVTRACMTGPSCPQWLLSAMWLSDHTRRSPSSLPWKLTVKDRFPPPPGPEPCYHPSASVLSLWTPTSTCNVTLHTWLILSW